LGKLRIRKHTEISGNDENSSFIIVDRQIIILSEYALKLCS